MFTNEDIERVARVLRETLWTHGCQLSKEINEELARAAIEAMREPTGEMFETAAYYLGGSDRVRAVWYDLIDVMLEEDEE